MYLGLSRTSILLFMISVSFFGLFLVIALTFNPPLSKHSPLWRRPIVGSVFGLICVLGSLAVFFPKKCSAGLHGAESAEVEVDSSPIDHTIQRIASPLKGHHPDCGNFSAHVIKFNNKTYCAACTGLLLGALLALVGTGLYFFGSFDAAPVSRLTVLFGTLGVGVGLFQLLFRRFVRLLFNSLFVLGTFAILIGIDQLTQSVLIDVFLIVLIGFWLFTRILISEWDHWRICHNCKIPCESGLKQK